MNKLLLGCFAGMHKPNYLIDTIKDANKYDCRTFMFFTRSPMSFTIPPLKDLKIDEFKKLCVENNFNINNLVVHAPYVMNVGTDDIKKWNMSVEILKTEIDRTNKIGCKLFILHPGNNQDKKKGIEQIAKAINLVNKSNKNVIICLETMAGKGSEIGSKLEELKQIIDLVDNKKLIGACIDTCHAWDAGYDVSNVDEYLKNFDKIIGLDYLNVIHLNNSKNDLGSHKDRHENLEIGKIPFTSLYEWANKKSLLNIPKILETPDSKEYGYKKEIEMLNE